MFVRRGKGGARFEHAGGSDRGGLPASDEPCARSAAAHPCGRGEPGAWRGRPLHGAASPVAVSGGEDGRATSTSRTCVRWSASVWALSGEPVRQGRGRARRAFPRRCSSSSRSAARGRGGGRRSRDRSGVARRRPEAWARSRPASASSTGSTRTPGARRSRRARAGERELVRDERATLIDASAASGSSAAWPVRDDGGRAGLSEIA